MAELAVPVLFFSSGNNAAAGDGRALLSRHDMIKLGARLGDPVTVDISLSGEEVCTTKRSRRCRFLATVAPRNEQGKGVSDKLRIFAESMCIIDPTVQLNFSESEPPPPSIPAGHGQKLVVCCAFVVNNKTFVEFYCFDFVGTGTQPEPVSLEEYIKFAAGTRVVVGRSIPFRA